MNTKTHLTTLALALALPLAAGCGNDDSANGGGLDHQDPEAVARAYFATYYDCGARGAGLRWDLQRHDGGDDEVSKDEALADERDAGCRPTRIPVIETIRGDSRGEITEVLVTNPDACQPGQGTMILVKSEDGWLVDTAESRLDPRDGGSSVCVRNGSTG